jgi:hypothetical protein
MEQKPRSKWKIDIVKFDFDHWKREFIKGDDDVTLVQIAKKVGAPEIGALKARAKKEDGLGQRQDFRRAVSEAKMATQSMIAAEAQQRQIQVGRAGMALVVRAMSGQTKVTLPGGTEAMKDNSELIIAQLVKNPNSLAQLAKVFTDIERRALGMDMGELDMDKLTTEQLERIANGEDIRKVMSGG